MEWQEYLQQWIFAESISFNLPLLRVTYSASVFHSLYFTLILNADILRSGQYFPRHTLFEVPFFTPKKKLWKTVRQTRFQNNEIIAIRLNLLQICRPPVTPFDIFALLLKLPFNILSGYFPFLHSIWWQFLLLGLNFS